MNILDLLKGQLGDGLAGQLGGMLGEDSGKMGGAIGAALPSILGSILGKASTSEGAEELHREVSNSDGGLLDSMGDLFGGGAEATTGLQEKGGGILSMLLGDKLNGIIEMISKLSGIGSGSSGSLLKMLAPLIMSFIGKQVMSKGLNAQGLSSMLMEQKDSIMGAMPDGMGDALGLPKMGIMDSVSDAASTATAAATGAAGDVAEAGGSLVKTLLPLIVIGALAFVGYKMFGQPKPAGPEAGVIESLTSVFKDAESTVNGISDVASAETAKDTLTELGTKIDGVKDSMADLPDAAKVLVSDKIRDMLPGFTGLIDKVDGQEGIGSIIKPIVEMLIDKLKEMIVVG